MRVCLLHNYRERAQMSMKLYADRLGDALSDIGIDVERVQPADIMPQWLQRAPGMARLDAYGGRFVKYPLLARRLRGSVFHIVDHSHAHLVDMLPADRTVVTCHDLILLVLGAGKIKADFRPRLAPTLLRFAVKRLRTAGRVIADSEQTKRDIVELVGVSSERIEVVYPGLNYDYRPVEGAREHARRKWALGSVPVLLHVGQTGFYKNLEAVLRVVGELRKRGLPAVLVRAGQPLQPKHVSLAQGLRITDAVHDLGSLTDSELRELYNAADVLLFPSLYEGFGWPPLEAMACGLPVVSTRCGSLDEIVATAAETAAPDDITGLADHVERICSDSKAAAALRERGLENTKRFRWSAAAGRIAAIYNEISVS